jgi:hypothetical protein
MFKFELPQLRQLVGADGKLGEKVVQESTPEI